MIAPAAALGMLGILAGAHAQGNMSTAATDRQFLQKSAQGSVADEATAELGIQKAQDNTVQHYAIRVVEDHARLNMQLLLLAHTRNLTLPVTMEGKDQDTLQGLMGENGAAFDRAFLQQEVKVNAMDVQDAQKELGATADPQVRDFVQEFLNTEQVHLAQARELLAKTQK